MRATRSPLAVACALALLGLVALLAVSLQAGWRGGNYVRAVLVATSLLLTFQTAQALGQSDRAEEGAWRDIGRAARATAALVVLVVPLGIYLGLPLFLYWMLRLHAATSRRSAVLLALVAGPVLAWVFGWALSLRLWPGLAPELIPGFLGGGLLPSL